jgi:NAD(P)-dependent dehydrogenase (short-subunit alcohol dehydrogenase family)
MVNEKSMRPVALVTGAARGIGRECAISLAKSGFHVLLNDRDEHESRELMNALVSEIQALGSDSTIVAADVSVFETHAAMIRKALEKWGRVDCLVNNAGVGVMRRGDLLEVTPESFDRCILVNTRSVFFLSQAVARHLAAQGEIGGQHRSIINVTSSNAVAVSVSRGEYCISKCASSMTTRLFAVRLAETGIGVYEVRPGIIETEMTLPAKERYDSLIAEGLVPARRWGYAADVAATVTAMAAGRLPYTVGQAITVDGGLTIPRF